MKKFDIESAGIVTYRMLANGSIEYLLLQHLGDYWDFPKGKVEQGETLEQTAVRELQEETSLTVVVDKNFFQELSYAFFTTFGTQLRKRVSYFVGQVQPDSQVRLSHEHKNYRWLAFEEASKLVTYDNSREVLINAHRYLSQKL